MKTKKRQRPINICQITVYPDRRRIRIEGDYIYHFYQRLKEIIPWTERSYIEQGRYWMVEKRFFCRIFELAYEYFDKIVLFENNRADEFITGAVPEPATPGSFCLARAKSFWTEQEKRV